MFQESTTFLRAFENDDDDDHGNNLLILITQLLTDNVFKCTQKRPKGKEGK